MKQFKDIPRNEEYQPEININYGYQPTVLVETNGYQPTAASTTQPGQSIPPTGSATVRIPQVDVAKKTEE